MDKPKNDEELRKHYSYLAYLDELMEEEYKDELEKINEISLFALPTDTEDAWKLFQQLSKQQRLTLWLRRQDGKESEYWDEVLRAWWRARY